MKPTYQEEPLIISKPDGSYVCQLRWQKKIYEEKLPRHIERWPKAEFKSHLDTVVARLRATMLKEQKDLLDTGKIDPTEILPVMELSATDAEMLAKAREKRQMRAQKLKKLVH